MSRPFFGVSMLNAAGAALMMGAVVPFEGVLARRMGAGPELLMLLAMSPFFGFLANIPASRLAYRYGLSRLTGVITVLTRGTLLAFAFALSPRAFVILLVVMHVFAGSGAGIQASLMKIHVRDSVRSSILKWLRILSIAASAPAAWIAGRLMDSDQASYRVLFPMAGFIGIVCALGFFSIPARSGDTRMLSKKPSLREEARVLKKDRRFTVFLFVFFIGTLAEKIGMPITPIYFADILNLKYEDVALAMGMAGPALGIAGYFFWGRILKRHDPLTVLTICMLLKSIRPVLWAMAGSSQYALGLVTLGQAAFRFSVSGLEIGVLLAIMRMSSDRDVATYMALHFGFMGVRGIAGPIMGTSMYRAGVNLVAIYWLIAAIVMAGGIALTVFATVSRRLSPSGGTGSHED